MTAEIRGQRMLFINDVTKKGGKVELERPETTFFVEYAFRKRLYLNKIRGWSIDKNPLDTNLTEAVISGGVVISAEKGDVITIRNGEIAVEILDDRLFRRFVGTEDGFTVDGERGKLRNEYHAGESIVTSGGVNIKATRGEWR